MNKGRKITGGKYHSKRKQRLHERKFQERPVVLGETKRKFLRVNGGNIKVVLIKTKTVNLLVGKKIQKAEIINVEETPQNKFLSRQNRLMKGAIIETNLGKSRITNRPSQEGHINGVLLESEK